MISDTRIVLRNLGCKIAITMRDVKTDKPSPSVQTAHSLRSSKVFPIAKSCALKISLSDDLITNFSELSFLKMQ